MRMRRLFLSMLCASVVLGAVPAAAQGGVCLRSQQIDNWEVVDDNTLLVTDRRDLKYKIGIIGTCTGLQQARFSLGFETLSELSCIRPGDAIRYEDLTFGPERCTISSIVSFADESPKNGEVDG